MARLFSEKPANAEEAERFQRYFKKHGRYTAGVETRYERSLITAAAEHQALAPGYPLGKRFHSALAIRLADAKPMELGHVIKADGRWRLMGLRPCTIRVNLGERLRSFVISCNTTQPALYFVTRQPG